VEHNGKDFDLIHWSIPIQQFDYARTGYRLEGKHAATACRKCHQPSHIPAANARNISVKDLNRTYLGLSGKCADCHKTDPHRGKFASAPPVYDCEYCHTVSGFKPSTFGIAQHNATGFPLKERHAETQCAKCHVADASGVVIYRIRAFFCAASHRDIHESQFAGEPYLNRCDACHTESAFKPSTFTAARHESTRFALFGGHAKITCPECHKPDQRPVQFRFGDISCTACHEDPHLGEEFIQRDRLLPDKTEADCLICHSLNTWQELKKFDHSTTGFSLDGEHRSISCTKCHESSGSTETRKILFSASPKKCAGCHLQDYSGTTDPNHKSAGFSQDCALCHNVTSWTQAIFDHNATAFPLTGAHTTVPCASCDIGGIYAGTPTDCYSCHSSEYNTTTDPNHAAAMFPKTCLDCHLTTTWSGATFTHSLFPIYSGSHAGRWTTRGDCHTNSNDYSVFTCTTCHTKAATDSEHGGVSNYIYNGANCYSRHPTGQSD
jgi:predicted CXXCH cytochrome family protein